MHLGFIPYFHSHAHDYSHLCKKPTPVRAEALGKIGSDAAISELVKTLIHANANVRGMAAYALGKIGSNATISELVKALNYEDFVQANNGDTLEQATEVFRIVQEKLKLYDPTLTQPISTPET